LPEGTEEKHRNSQLGYLVYWSGFQPGTSGIQVRSPTDLASFLRIFTIFVGYPRRGGYDKLSMGLGEGKKGKAYRIFTGKPLQKRPLGRHGIIWIDNIKMVLRKTICDFR
jgi:hypothetical protein